MRRKLQVCCPGVPFRRFAYLPILVVASLGNVQRIAADEPAAATSKVNVVFILADDLGWGELGCYGQQKIPTPHIDRLAAEGMRFTQHYSGAPVCAPARCVLLTGRHRGQYGYLPHPRPRAGYAAMISDLDGYVGRVMAALEPGDFKVVRQGLRTKSPGEWEVYYLANDIAEANDLAARHPEVIREAEEVLRREVPDNPVFPLAIPGVNAPEG